jgi:hypothetical protein
MVRKGTEFPAHNKNLCLMISILAEKGNKRNGSDFVKIVPNKHC